MKITFQTRINLILLAIFLAVAMPARAFSPDTYAAHSRLATGHWVKLSVTESGIYAITASDASKWGIRNLDNLRIFGYGGKQLPESLSIEDYTDDLTQVPVLREGGKVIFYAHGIISWRKSKLSDMRFTQVQHPYAVEGYYFVTEDASVPDLLVEKADNHTSGGANAVNTFTERIYHEKELYSPSETGRVLWGEDFRYSTQQKFQFTLDGYVDESTVEVLTDFGAAVAGGPVSIQCSYNGTNLEKVSGDDIRPITSEYQYINNTSSLHTFSLKGTKNLTYGIVFNYSGTLKEARLNYITVNYERHLDMAGQASLPFSVYEEDDNQYNIAGTNADTHVWNVTKQFGLKEMNVSHNGAVTTFAAGGNLATADYVAFNATANHPAPKYVGTVANQDLHGLETPDMIILAPAEFMAQARRVAALHEQQDSMRVYVIDHRLVFNEFSSGTPDVMAYRRLCKMFYDRGTDAEGHHLQHLLFFGNGSYDNRRLTSVVDYPTLLLFESEESSNEEGSYTTDDVFAFLADGATTAYGSQPLLIAVGRMPVKSVDEAKVAVDKLLTYVNTKQYGTWKTNVINVADDENQAVHMEQADAVIQNMQDNGGNDLMYNRIYLDAFAAVSNGAGRSYPEATKKFIKLMNEGALWVNYTGHANPREWSHEGFLTYTDMRSIYNRYLPVMYTATCEFTRHDATELSGGEYFFLNPNGGVVALISACRTVFIPSNGALNAAAAKYVFKRDKSGRLISVGEAMRRAKCERLSDTNKLRYILYGDPALRIKLPLYRAVVKTINDLPVSDTQMPVFQARQTIIISGEIEDPFGVPATEFNGEVVCSLFDAEQSVETHGYGEGGEKYVYQDRSNKLAITMSKVTGGKFNIEVVVPSELAAPSKFDNYSTALVNLYAYSEASGEEAIGNNEQFYIYGFDEDAEVKTTGPKIEMLGLNSDEFQDGTDVNESPLLVARVSDEAGINFSTGGVGHNITLLLDETTSYADVASYYSPIYVEGAKGSVGKIAYPMSNLTEGEHQLRLRVWDVFNNASEATVKFNVVKGLRAELYDVYTTANPASVEAKFYLKHNRPNSNITVTLEVFDLMGRPVWRTTETGPSDMYTSFPITWDLGDMAGRRVTRGIYIYRATIIENGTECATKSKKIAVTAP